MIKNIIKYPLIIFLTVVGCFYLVMREDLFKTLGKNSLKNIRNIFLAN
ncbi:hypothetical protein KKB54_03420 [bacterium]|nr:hypothetical protein [bacterium]MBU0899847.1 hypothetical protein [bacterium]MBU1153829.1 hypothetical protein [bacterium]MBU2599578.1 hypothetical protein [bacterium]